VDIAEPFKSACRHTRNRCTWCKGDKIEQTKVL